MSEIPVVGPRASVYRQARTAKQAMLAVSSIQRDAASLDMHGFGKTVNQSSRLAVNTVRLWAARKLF